MKRITLLPLALLLTAGVFSTTACSEQAAPPAPTTSSVSALIKTDVKTGEGTEATAGRNVSVHYTGWLYDEAAP
ncbi:MAG: FKBP-type peptidyl-prolyl cis-trans isomerase, partial [Gallionella sp.]|nr:FKBP-type peptidyl-prolyl cis-trans isomerase [Gallionella sp.]